MKVALNVVGENPPSSAHGGWRALRRLVWTLGVGLLAALVFAPELGIHAFWNVLIPVAPALLVLAPGLWRNICPLGTSSLLPRRYGSSRRIKLSRVTQGYLALGGVVLLLILVPLRHVILDTSGQATAIVVGGLGLLALSMGQLFEWKSGWCASLCPVHPVERLYGTKPMLAVHNAQCSSCERCVSVCADATRGLHVLTERHSLARRAAGSIMAGGFVGFVWGWFQVPDYAGIEGWAHLGRIYGVPLAAGAATLMLFVAFQQGLGKPHERKLVLGFAAAAVACYYYYRLPALVGFGVMSGDGVLVDLTTILPAWLPIAMRVVTTAFFAWWLVFRGGPRRSWGLRPRYAERPAAEDGILARPRSTAGRMG